MKLLGENNKKKTQKRKNNLPKVEKYVHTLNQMLKNITTKAYFGLIVIHFIYFHITFLSH